MDINQATAKAIAAERAIADLTVRELSEKSGIPLSTLMRILGAEREIKVTQVDRLAQAFGIYPHEIIERAEAILGRQALPPAKVTVLRSVPTPMSDLGDTVAARDSDDDAEAEAQTEDA